MRNRSKGRSGRFSLECLEGRELLTGGFGNQFAEAFADVTAAGGTASAQFTIDPSLIKRPRGSFLLGIDASAFSSNVQPTVVAVDNARGRPLPGLSHAVYDPTVQAKLNGKTQTSAVLVSIPASAAGKTLTVSVAAQNGTSGSAQLGFYLPGDVDGDGTVTKADLKAIRADEGSVLGDANYALDADSNRNGKIDKTDLIEARKDLGVSTTILPTVDASIASSSNFDAATRKATAAGVTVQGTATPGSTVELTELNNQIPKVGAVADASGHFQVTGQLAPGSDTLTLTSTDGFGQASEETMLPITYATGGKT